MTDARLFGRVYRLTVGDVLIDSTTGDEVLDIEFRADRTLKKDPNTLDLRIYNLNEDNRRRLETQKNPVVQLEAGYEERFGTVFLGDVREVSSVQQPPDWVTQLESGDGEKPTQFDRINKSFRAGTSLPTVIREIAKSMPDIGTGNLNEVADGAALANGDQQFVNGVTVSGSASREMSRLIRSAGLEWSIQNQKFQLLEAGQTLATEAVLLTPETGLVGSPTVSAKGILNFVSLLNSDIVPGRQLEVRSRQVEGFFRVERCTYEGSVSGGGWYVSGEAKKIGTTRFNAFFDAAVSS
jgi:hypothetical protein